MAELDVKKVLAHLVEDGGTLVATIHNISSLPLTIEDSKFKSEYVSVNEVFSNPSAQTADWKVTTANGSFTIDVDKASPTDTDRANAISGTTDVTLYLNPTNSPNSDCNTTVITTNSFSSLPFTVSSSDISAYHYCVKSVLSNPSAQTASWRVKTRNGSLTIDADYDSPTSAQRADAISGSTTVTLYLMEYTAT